VSVDEKYLLNTQLVSKINVKHPTGYLDNIIQFEFEASKNTEKLE